MPGFMPGCPLVRKSDGGVAFSEDFGDTIHGRRELFRLLLCQVLTKPRMESPSRFDFFALDTRHNTDEFNIGAGGSPRSSVCCGRGRIRRCVHGGRRSLSLEDPGECGNHGTDTERCGGCHLWIARGSEQASNAIAEIAVHVVLGWAVFGHQEAIAFIGLAAFGHGCPDG